MASASAAAAKRIQYVLRLRAVTRSSRATMGRKAMAENTKFQTPNSKQIPNAKHQLRAPDPLGGRRGHSRGFADSHSFSGRRKSAAPDSPASAREEARRRRVV